MSVRDKNKRSIFLIVIGSILFISTIVSLLFACNVLKKNNTLDENRIGTLASKTIKVTIKFNNNGGYGGQKSNIVATYKKAMPKLSSENPSKKGYTFMGWYDNKDYTKGKKYYTTEGKSARKLDKNKTLTLYAGWKKNTYLTGSTLTNFKKDNNLNNDSNIVISKHSTKVSGISINYYLVYNKKTFSEASYNKFNKYINNSFDYIKRVDKKILKFLKKNGLEIVFLGHYDCDNGDKEIGYSTFAAYCNSNIRKIVIGYSDNYLNNPFYEGSVIHEMGHLYDISLRYVLSGEKETALTGLTAKEIKNGFGTVDSKTPSKYVTKKVSAKTLKPLFLFKGSEPYTWSYLAKTYAIPLLDVFEDLQLSPRFSAYSKQDLSNSSLEFYAELFNAYFWSSEYRSLIKKTAPIAYEALLKTFSYVK